MGLASPLLMVRWTLVVGRVVSLPSLVVALVPLPPPSSVVTVMRGVMALVGPLGIGMGVACHLRMAAATSSRTLLPAPRSGHVRQLVLKVGVAALLELALVLILPSPLASLAAWVGDHPSSSSSHTNSLHQLCHSEGELVQF